MVNTELLNQTIKDKGLRKDFIASSLDITKQALSAKINNKYDFRSSECTYLRKILHLDDHQFVKIFYAFKRDCEAQNCNKSKEGTV